MRREYKGAAQASVLTVGLGASTADLTIFCNDLTNWPTGVGSRPFYVVIDRGKSNEEKILCASRSGNVLTVYTSGLTNGRAADGTPISSHTINAVIEHVFTATDADEANAHVNASGTAHGLELDKVVTTDATQTLTGKTLASPTITSQSSTGGTLTNATLATPTVTGGTITNATVATPTITGATVSSPTITNPTITGATISSSNIRLPIVAKTASHTLATDLSDAGKLIEMNSASALTLTIPADATANYPVETQIAVLQTGAGQVTIAGAAGVTVNGAPGLKLRSQWASATLVKRGANLWSHQSAHRPPRHLSR